MAPLRTLAICCSWQPTIRPSEPELNALDMKADEDSYTEEPVSDETRVPIPLAENTGHNTEGTQKIAIPHEDWSEPQTKKIAICHHRPHSWCTWQRDTIPCSEAWAWRIQYRQCPDRALIFWTPHWQGLKKYECFHITFISLKKNLWQSKCTVNICFCICFAQA